jgi:hypothetical protein
MALLPYYFFDMAHQSLQIENEPGWTGTQDSRAMPCRDTTSPYVLG